MKEAGERAGMTAKEMFGRRLKTNPKASPWFEGEWALGHIVLATRQPFLAFRD